jgi:hypothetical protein
MHLAGIALTALGLVTAQPAGAPATRIFEMRIYYAAPGKLDALHARFRDHTMKLFEKHGMTNVGYWVPAGDNPDRKLVYLLSYPNPDARKKAWAGFLADEDWRKAARESEKDGRLVAKIESIHLVPTDYSKPVAGVKSASPRLFELRTYTATTGNLAALNARFRDHTLKLFEKHGMTNLWYFTPAAGQKNADTTLIYFLAHQDDAARKKSFDAFRADPDWITARTASEKKAGGSLTEKDGVKSELLMPTDYSPLK